MPDLNVRQELERVARLQQVDSQLRELELEKGDLPGLVKKLQEEIDRRQSDRRTLEERLGELGKQMRSNEGQVQLLKVKLDKYQEQLYSVTTNREYDAINSEIEALKGQTEQIGKTQTDLQDEEEKLDEQVGNLSGRVGEMEAELKERQGELGSRNKEAEEEELELQHERDKLAVRLKKPILAHYERIRDAREGVGAAHLYAGACGACFAVVPPQRQAEIRKMEDIILCESCGVILLPEEEHLDLE